MELGIMVAPLKSSLKTSGTGVGEKNIFSHESTHISTLTLHDIMGKKSSMKINGLICKTIGQTLSLLKLTKYDSYLIILILNSEPMSFLQLVIAFIFYHKFYF